MRLTLVIVTHSAMAFCSGAVGFAALAGGYGTAVPFALFGGILGIGAMAAGPAVLLFLAVLIRNVLLAVLLTLGKRVRAIGYVAAMWMVSEFLCALLVAVLSVPTSSSDTRTIIQQWQLVSLLTWSAYWGGFWIAFLRSSTPPPS